MTTTEWARAFVMRWSIPKSLREQAVKELADEIAEALAAERAGREQAEVDRDGAVGAYTQAARENGELRERVEQAEAETERLRADLRKACKIVQGWREKHEQAERLVGAMRQERAALLALMVSRGARWDIAPGNGPEFSRIIAGIASDDATARLGAEWASLRTLYERTAEMRRLFERGGTGNVGGQMVRVFEAVDEVERVRLAQ